MILKQNVRIENPEHLAGGHTTAPTLDFHTGNTQKNEIPKSIGFAEISFQGCDRSPLQTQGSSFLATLGWRAQSLWDCRFKKARGSNARSLNV
jgi:hypothetical protein